MSKRDLLLKDHLDHDDGAILCDHGNNDNDHGDEEEEESNDNDHDEQEEDEEKNTARRTGGAGNHLRAAIVFERQSAYSFSLDDKTRKNDDFEDSEKKHEEKHKNDIPTVQTSRPPKYKVNHKVHRSCTNSTRETPHVDSINSMRQ